MASTQVPSPPKRFAGPDLTDHPEFQKYGGRRLTWKEVEELEEVYMHTKHEYILQQILRAAGWIWDNNIKHFCYEVEYDYYLGEPKRNEHGCITPDAMMEWYDDAVARGVLPEELNEETANLIYGAWQVDHFNYRKGTNKRYEKFWDEVDQLVYGDRHISEEDLKYLEEESREVYEHADEI